jgi:hypothetical protein
MNWAQLLLKKGQPISSTFCRTVGNVAFRNFVFVFRHRILALKILQERSLGQKLCPYFVCCSVANNCLLLIFLAKNILAENVSLKSTPENAHHRGAGDRSRLSRLERS